MKRKRHSPEQIIGKLREADRMLSEGQTIGEVCPPLEIVEATFHRWRNPYGGMKADDAQQLKELEVENGRLKKLVADLTLDKPILEETRKGKGGARRAAGLRATKAGARRCQRRKRRWRCRSAGHAR